jgi:hypothetical protein
MGMLVGGSFVLLVLVLWMTHGAIDRGPPPSAMDRNVPGTTTGAGQNSLISKPGTAP